MYKILTVFFAILLFSWQISFSQNTFTGYVGANYSSVSSKNSINPDGILGMNAGLAYKIYIGDLGWAIMPGVGFSQEGFKGQRLNYLNMPLSVGFDFTSTFNVSAGFQYGQFMGGSEEAKQVFYSSNFAFLITFEFFPTKKFVTGFRFANGIKNIIKEPDTSVVQNASTYAIQFYVGITLFRGSK